MNVEISEYKSLISYFILELPNVQIDRGFNAELTGFRDGISPYEFRRNILQFFGGLHRYATPGPENFKKLDSNSKIAYIK
jgi:hypothetical protein